MRTVRLVESDLIALYGKPKWVALLTNPCATAALIVRLTTNLPMPLSLLFRWIGLVVFSVDVSPRAKIGAKLRLPHPLGIVIGERVNIGDDVTIYQGVTLGNLRGSYPKIGNGCTIYPGAVVVGAIEVGDRAVIGALTYVAKSVFSGGKVRGDNS
mgnify:CR=1 FL=1